MLSKKNLYTWLLCGLLIVCWAYNAPAADKPKDQQRPSGIHRIVIDPGFGGKELGAPGYIEGIYSKDVNLQIAKKLAREIRETLGIDTILTRDTDECIALEDRTAIANSKRADLFISIQCNTHSDESVYGIETYYSGAAADEGTTQPTRPETQTSKKSDVQTILSDIRLDAHHEESCQLANHVQKSLSEYMSARYSLIKDRGVRQAPFVVLLGADMPSIVIEVSFISNPRECNRLISEDYQSDLCKAITNGIRRYIEQKNFK